MKQLLGLVVAMGLVVGAQAGTTYSADVGTPYQTPALSTFVTTGGDMDGMNVYAKFSDGTIQSAPWAADPSAAVDDGYATVANWFKISLTGDSFVSPWTIQNLQPSATAPGLEIVAFGMFGPSGDVVFDRTLPSFGTDGSAQGKDLSFLTPTDASVKYSDIVNLTGFPAVGDLYASVDVVLGANNPIRAGASTQFYQDTDSAATKGTIIRVPDMGSTGLLVGLGLIAVGALRRRS